MFENLHSVIVLLQVVLSLLSNPQTANNPQTKQLSTMAISLAVSVLNSQPSPNVVMGNNNFSILTAPVITSSPSTTIDTNSAIQNPLSCSLRGETEYKVLPFVQPGPQTTFIWTIAGSNASQITTATFTGNVNGGNPIPVNPQAGEYVYPDAVQGMIQLNFGNTYCATYFPDIPWTSTSTSYVLNSTQTP